MLLSCSLQKRFAGSAPAFSAGVRGHGLLSTHSRTSLRVSATETEEKARADTTDRQPGTNGTAPDSLNSGKAGNISTGKDSKPDDVRAELSAAVKRLPEEQQQALSDVYMYLVQHPDSQLDFRGFQQGRLKQIVDQYQVLLWRPAELLNGRMAMIGFVAGIAAEARTGASIWQQLYYAPYAYVSAYVLIVLAALLNKQFGSPSQGVGPFNSEAELLNGRAAMVGYALLAFLEYKSDITKAALVWAQQIQHLQVPGTTA